MYNSADSLFNRCITQLTAYLTDVSLSWQPILEYIDAKYEEYLNAEGHVNRSTVVDNRVHCCLYFISPGHG